LGSGGVGEGDLGLGDVGAGVFGVGVFNLELSDVGDGFVEGGVGSRTEAGGTGGAGDDAVQWWLMTDIQMRRLGPFPL